MEWIIENKEWLFSGIGVTILVAIAGLFIRNKRDGKNVQTIKSGDNSTNIQGGEKVNINIGGKDNA
ncbi:hypothetical protein [Clostridium perfringens]|uniref:hypothetical protein n=1 Tax=Clostridium perfringens TaxID=1502 RepID=UPI0008A6A837|nr:hypothetical protein [Clostridium perfringens]AOY53363.1 hypothetical protein FORC25_0945 [Clostridium perfringens]MDK0680000.1 hypothetical protein [Clostridium perfringens]MDK0856468.1 hypothetical protein [Clostridium perfringens]UUW66920.1 hypothetical protein NQ197_04880 [Clostridium perfringens]HAT4254964.1 hypothetical protein [Clostridium perfringens]